MIRLTHPLFASLLLATPLAGENTVFQAFEGDGFDDWKISGKAFGIAPVSGTTEGMAAPFTGYSNDYLTASNQGGPAATGTLTSPEFTLDDPKIAFLIAGGDQPGKTAAQLLVGGKVVREATGKKDLELRQVIWDVAEFIGQKAVIRLVDEATDEWGFIAVDQILLTDEVAPKFPSTTRDGKVQVQGLANTDVVAGVTIPPDTTLKVEATYQDQKLMSPTALAFDDAGNIFISETHRFRFGVEDDRNHLYWYLDDLASKTTADRRALHEKWKDKVSMKHMTDTSEVIRRLADTDGDGKLDESKVFADGFQDVLDGTAAGLFHYEGTLYFSCIPKIWMLRDTNGDGISDERKVVEEGFGVRVSLSGHDLNGFALGPDGRIYGTIGDRGYDLTTKEGRTYHYPNEGAAFRFEPDGTGFEIFHTGLRNPKEIAFDALGNAFSVDNNSDQGDAARVVYLVEGGDSGWQMEHQAMHTFHRQIGLEDHPPGRWMAERMWELENESQPAFMLPPIAYLTSGPSGLTVHPGTGFLESEAGRFLICDYRGGAANSGIWSFEMKPKDAGMEMTGSRKLNWGVAATDVEYSWDGRLFITDFVTGWESHQDGRLLSIDAGEKTWRAAEAKDAANLIREGFNQRDSAELAGLLKHLDSRVRLRAQIALTRKPDAVEKFIAATASADLMERVHGIWGLGIVVRRGSSPLPVSEFGDLLDETRSKPAKDQLIALLKDPDEEIRAQVLRVLADTAIAGDTLPLGPLLGDDSPRVRFFAAIATGKLKALGNYSAILDLLAENDNKDVHLRHAGIFALQHIARNPLQLTALADHESAAVRLAAAVGLRRMNDPGIALFLGDEDPKVDDEAIRAICDNDIIESRPAVADLLDDLGSRKWTPFMLRRLIHNSFRIGTPENAERVLKVAADPAMPREVREEALRLIGVWTEPFPADQLTGHWRPLPKRDAAEIKPLLEPALPGLLKQGGFVLTRALGLIERYQLNVATLDDTTLRGLVANAGVPADARAKALELYIAREPADLDTFLAEVAVDPVDEISLVALSNLTKRSPDAALAPLEAAVDSGKAKRAQKAWEIIAPLSGARVAGFFKKHLDQLAAAKGVSPHALELMAAAKTRGEPEVAAALAELEKSLAENPDPLVKWNPSLEGGDPESGAALFASNPASECMRCHNAEEGHGAGGDAGPNLTGIAKRHTDPRYFLESMVSPSATIAPGFGAILVTLTNGASVGGTLIEETPDHIDLNTGEKAVRIKRSDVKSFTPPVSPMPPMAGVLGAPEMRDLVAWLGTLDKGGEKPKAAVAPETLDLSTVSAPVEKTAVAAGAVDPAAMKIGQQQFIVCGACHGQSGEGTAAGPPLAGSEWVTGPAENLIRIQLRGLIGPIKVKGTEHNFPGGMQPLAYQTDEQIAAVLTYIRNSFGNKASGVAPGEITALRGEVGKPQLVVADLKPPEAAAPAPAEAAPANDAGKTSGKYDRLESDSPFKNWMVIAAGAFVAISLVPILKRR